MPPRKSCDVAEPEARRQSGRKRSVATYAEGGDTEQEAQDTVGGGRKRKLEEADQPARRASRASASGAAGTQAGPPRPGTSSERDLTCLVCSELVKVEGDLKEARFHYTICLFQQGGFELLEEYRKKGSDGEKIYSCLQSDKGCSAKKYTYYNFCLHMATSHGFDPVARIMARHDNPAMGAVLARLFPDHEETLRKAAQAKEAIAKLETKAKPVKAKPGPKSQTQVASPAIEDPDEMEVAMDGKNLWTAGTSKNLGATKGEDASDNDIKATQAKEASVKLETKPKPVKAKPGPKSRTQVSSPKPRVASPAAKISSYFRPAASTPAVEAVERPVLPPVELPALPVKSIQTSQKGLKVTKPILAEAKPVVKSAPPPVLSSYVAQAHTCLVCRGKGPAGKEGKALKRGAANLQALLYHYAACFYTESCLLEVVDCGLGNRAQGGGVRDQYAKRFKYKCPFVWCDKNSGRKVSQMGFKEYAIHCAVRHHAIERLLAGRAGPEWADLLGEVVEAREAKGEAVEVAGLDVEEQHICLLCKGESKEGRDLSFLPGRLSALRYHYASCFYDFGVYLAKYPPGEENMDGEGRVKDAMGVEMKYQCSSPDCTVARRRKQMGYKEHCIHMSNEHGGLEDVLAGDAREEVRALAARLAQPEDSQPGPALPPGVPTARLPPAIHRREAKLESKQEEEMVDDPTAFME